MMQGWQKGLAAPVRAGPVFLKLKIKLCFYKEQIINQSASVIFGLVRLIVLDRKSTSKGRRLSAAYAYAYKVLCCVSNTQSTWQYDF